MRAVIDAAGRIVVPKPLRDALHLKPGTELVLRVVEGRLENKTAPLDVELRRRGRYTVAVPRKPVPKLDQRDVDRTARTIRDARGGIA